MDKTNKIIMEKKLNWTEYQSLLNQHNITKLYHFTDRDNLRSIIENGGLFSWADCEEKGIKIAKPGGGQTSRDLDRRDNLHHYARVSFVKEHPMQYVAMREGRISDPVCLEIDPEVIYWKDTKYADRNATKNGANVGGEYSDFQRIHFRSLKVAKHFDLNEDEREFFQAEVLVKNFIPLEYITNIRDFGIPIPEKTRQNQSREAYTAPPVTMYTPTKAKDARIDVNLANKKTENLISDKKLSSVKSILEPERKNAIINTDKTSKKNADLQSKLKSTEFSLSSAQKSLKSEQLKTKELERHIEEEKRKKIISYVITVAVVVALAILLCNQYYGNTNENMQTSSNTEMIHTGTGSNYGNVKQTETKGMNSKSAHSNPKPSGKITNIVSLSYGKFEPNKEQGGSIKNGYPEGVGKLIYTQSRIINKYDKKNRIAEKGDYIVGEFKNGFVVHGKLYDSSNKLKSSLMIGNPPDDVYEDK